jgi:four helix bundle protein
MSPEAFKKRTKTFALRIIKLIEQLPKTTVAQVIGRQLLRSGTSVGANYRAACRARSRADFIAKLCIVEEECDESLYWMELLIESGVMKSKRLSLLMTEAGEILAMVVQSVNTTRRGAKPATRIPQSTIVPSRSATGPDPSGQSATEESVSSNPQSAIRNPQFP